MTFVLAGIILLALCVISILTMSLMRRNGVSVETPGAAAMLLSLWLISAAVWGRRFLEIGIPGLFDLTIDRLLLMCMLFFLLIGLFTRKVGSRKHNGLELTLLAFVMVCLISMTLHGFLPALPSLPSPWNNFINGYLIPVIVFFFAKYFIQHPADIRLVLRALFLFGVYLCVLSVFEFFRLDAFVFPRYISDPEIPIHFDRARGPLLNAAFNGGAMTFCFICGMHLLADTKGFSRLRHLALLSLTPPAIFFTQTRSAYLGFLLALGLYFFFYHTDTPKWKAFSLPIAFVLIATLAMIPRLTSEDRKAGGVVQIHEIDIRMALIGRSMKIVAIEPFFGVGLGQFLPVSASNIQGEAAIQGINAEPQHFHVLGLAAELGITGAAIYLTMITIIFKRLVKLRRVLPKTGFISCNFLLALASVWMVHLTTNLFLEPSYCLFFNAVPFAFAGFADGLYLRHIE